MSTTYTKNFLKSVVFRIDYDGVELGQLENFYVAGIKERFQDHKAKTISEGIFEINMERNEMMQKKIDLTAWRFETKENDKVTKALEISSKYLFIEYHEYKNSEELFADVEAVMRQFIESFQVKTINRIGLRFSNVISLDEVTTFGEWDEYIDENLLGILKFAVGTGKPSARAMGQVVSKEEDGDITINFGIFNKNFPSEASPKEFILDFDCASILPFECNIGIIEKVKKYKAHIGLLFESCITDAFRAILNSQNPSA